MSVDTSAGKPAFTALVERHGRELYIYLWRMLGHEQDAEDCLQEAFLNAHRSYPGLRSHANLRAWLYRIAGNQARTFLRRQGSRARKETDWGDGDHGSEMSAEKVVDRRLALQEVRQAVEDLPPRQRQALFLRKYQELTYAEIALVQDCGEQAARANVYQALRKLRGRFASAAAQEEKTA